MSMGLRKAEPLRNVTNKQNNKIIKKPTRLTQMEKIVYQQQEVSDSLNITMVSKYANSVFEYFELIDKPALYCNDGISWRMRSLLVDWIINIHDKLGLADDTLYFTINLIDRFLAVRTIPGTKLQLVGISALMISCKYEEVACPTIQTMVMICENTVSDEDIRKAEKYMLHTLNYKIEFGSPLNFLRKCSKANNYEVSSKTVGKYLLELSLLFEDFKEFKDSIKAASSMYLARKITEQDQCKNLFMMYSGHTKEEIKDCFNVYIKIINDEIPYENIQAKYNAPKYYKVASYVKEYARNNFR